MVKRKVFIDTDAGGDDAIGIMCALTQTSRDVEVVGISVVWGNVDVDQGVTNAGKLLDLFDLDIPLYRGADRPLMGVRETVQWGGFGADGFGDADFPETMKHYNAHGKHAAMGIIDWVNSIDPTDTDTVHQLVTLGPLTNVALAIRLYPNLFDSLGGSGIPGLVVMGGTIEAKGNSSLTSEFNIHCDPEAANIVFLHKGLTTPLYLVSWELCVNCAMTWSFYDQWVNRRVLPNGDRKGVDQNRLQIFIEKMFQRLEVFTRPKDDGTRADTGDAEVTQDVTCVIPDAVAVVCALFPECIVDSVDTFVTIELSGRESRGMTCIDWYGTDQSLMKRGRWRNCKVVTKADVEVFLSAMKGIVEFNLDG